MTLADRINDIIREQGITQAAFARELGVSANYVNLLARGGKTNISETLAKLIEKTYGYGAQWVLEGTGEKELGELSAGRAEVIDKVRRLSDCEALAVLAFVKTMEEVRSQYKNRPQDKTQLGNSMSDE